jgi:hypothetical protein
VPTEQAAHRVQCIALYGLNDLDVGSRSHGDGAVPQDPLNCGRLHAHGEEQRGARVT